MSEESKFIHIPIEDVTTPIDGATVMMDRWWTTIKEGHISVYIGGSKKSSMGSYRTYSPQCNMHKEIADRGNGAVFLPVVYFVDLLAGEQW